MYNIKQLLNWGDYFGTLCVSYFFPFVFYGHIFQLFILIYIYKKKQQHVIHAK